MEVKYSSFDGLAPEIIATWIWKINARHDDVKITFMILGRSITTALPVIQEPPAEKYYGRLMKGLFGFTENFEGGGGGGGAPQQQRWVGGSVEGGGQVPWKCYTTCIFWIISRNVACYLSFCHISHVACWSNPVLDWPVITRSAERPTITPVISWVL